MTLQDKIITKEINLPHLRSSIGETDHLISTLKKTLINMEPAGDTSADVDFVIFGSGARKECTEKSDVDWTLLVDGQANQDHLQHSIMIENAIIKSGINKPGSSGLFGQITFSHELIHNVGGEYDTNFNLSKRILLLLESIPIKEAKCGNGLAYERVLTTVISQYVINDSGFSLKNPSDYTVPRFLLNDIIRFWRTVCVDFAYKQKQQDGKKWAIRNLKLRTSRKLLYVKGLLMCYSCYKIKMSSTDVINQLKKYSMMTPINAVDDILRTKANISDDIVIKLFRYYDEFSALLHDSSFREEMERLNMLEVYDNNNFIKARSICDNFQGVLDEIFLKPDTELYEFIKKYGIF